MSAEDHHGGRRSDAWPLLAIVIVALALHLAGIRRDLPYVPEADEPIFLTAATHIAAPGDLNPRWFGHPGSTVVYPLALAVHTWHGIAHGGRMLAPDPNLAVAFGAIAPEFFLLGRLLAIAYAVLCVPLVYLVGRAAFARREALLGAAFAAVIPTAVWYAQIVRTDSAATFFALLALWRILVTFERPSQRNQLFAGAAIGLAAATRYFMVTLVPVLLIVDATLLLRARQSGDSLRPTLVAIGIGLAAAPIAFAVTSPYVLLDYQTALSDLRYEARSIQLGADSLSPAQNLIWYLTRALPEAMTAPLAILAAFGAALTVWRRQPAGLVLLMFPAVLIGAISLSSLHWTRWIIQILPVLALLAAHGMLALTDKASARAELDARARRWLVAATAIIVALPAVTQVAQNDLRQANDSTRIEARRWLLDEVPAGSKVGLEWWTAPMFQEDFQGFVRERSGTSRDGGGAFEVQQNWRLPDAGSVDDLRDAGFDYLVVSGSWFGPVLEYEADSADASFYRELLESGPPAAEFAGSRYSGGPLIRVYQLSPPR